MDGDIIANISNEDTGDQSVPRGYYGFVQVSVVR